jgi:hypothetical protein
MEESGEEGKKLVLLLADLCSCCITHLHINYVPVRPLFYLFFIEYTRELRIFALRRKKVRS